MEVHFGSLENKQWEVNTMLLYLTSTENIGLFDFLTKEKGILVKKLSGEFSLNRFVVHDMRNLSHFSYVAIDLEAIKDGVDGIIEAITAFKALYDSRIIIFAETTSITLINRIIEETETYNIITAKSIENIKEEINICTSLQGMNKEYLMKSINKSTDISMNNKPQYCFLGDNIKIIVAGAMNRVGTTTIAMNMASYLSSIGAKVSYTEANTSNHLEKIHACFFANIPIKNNYFTQSGVDYFFNSNIPAENYNFNIIDIGVLSQKNKKVFEIGQVKILCSGIKPYELPHLKKVGDIIDKENTSIVLNEGEYRHLIKTLEIDKEKIYSSKFSSNLFNKYINKDIWKSILSDYLLEHKTL